MEEPWSFARGLPDLDTHRNTHTACREVILSYITYVKTSVSLVAASGASPSTPLAH